MLVELVELLGRHPQLKNVAPAGLPDRVPGGEHPVDLEPGQSDHNGTRRPDTLASPGAHLSESFAVGALRRSASIEQFLGPAFHGERRGIRWVAIEPRRNGRYALVLYLSWDVGGEHFGDLLEFPPLDPEADDADEILAEVDDAVEALDTAERVTDAVRGRWVNFGVAVEDYFDDVRSGRLPDPLTKDDATNVVRTLRAASGDGRTVSWWLDGLARRTGCLHISDMIYWPASRSWTAEEIIDHAWSCTPIAL